MFSSVLLFHVFVNNEYFGNAATCRESLLRDLVFFITQQAAELAEFTAKIALLEEAKRKKEDEATEWQHKVM